MDRIYSGASLVIIAAAGDNPSYGLPGVSSRGRHPQRTVKTGNFTLVEMFPDIKASLMDSVWKSRAWTFQEGYLAKRRLIFTDQQVAYVCRDGTFVESFTSMIPRKDTCLVMSLETIFFSPHFWGTQENTTLDVLREYTKRELTYASDAFDACSGIFNFWSHSLKYPSGAHLWGVMYSAGWLNLVWHHPEPTMRRENFPSWS
jgi:hypothetical protein